jgi:DnaJ-class molecular chaperone
MSIAQTHLDIARERFLELMAEDPARNATNAAQAAIQQADEFAAAYTLIGYKAVDQQSNVVKLKGCRTCHGSGGKQFDPCKACDGTGKVPA